MFLSIIGSLLLGLVWLKFFRKIDSFEPESWKATFLCLGMGAVSPLLLEPLVGLSPFLKNLDQKSTGGDLLQFALFRVAALEELVKILPFILVLNITNWVDESVDYIKYPALSALGFATIENMIYAHSYGVDVLHIRGILCVSGHIFYTALPGYFYWISRNKSMQTRILYSISGYSIGLLSHGFYDYFIFEDQNSGTTLGILSVLLCVGFMYAFKRMIVETIRKSHFYNPLVLAKIYSAGYSLFWGLTGIFVFIGIALGIENGNIASSFAYWLENGLFALVGIAILYGLLAIDTKDVVSQKEDAES